MKLKDLLANLADRTEIVIKFEIPELDKNQIWYEGEAGDIPHTMLDYNADYNDSISVEDGKLEVTLGTPKRRNRKKNGWTPLSEGLPPLGKALIVTVKDHIRNRTELRYPVWYMNKIYSSGYAFYFGEIGNILLPDVSEVLAWMELPEPYESNAI